MKIHLISDLHMECGQEFIDSEVDANVVVLAGDIGDPFDKSYSELIGKMSDTYQKVFVIAGNHEYYLDRKKFFPNRNSMQEVENRIHLVCNEYSNVHFLQKDSYVWYGIRFLGCTLWSEITDRTLCKYINDFVKIPEMTFEKYQELHQDHKSWLISQLFEESDNYFLTCVITHHLPKKSLNNKKYKNHPLNCFFASDIGIEKIETYNVWSGLWCYGHTHAVNHSVINGTHYYCNPRGYLNEKTEYDPNLVIDLREIL